ncbi:MAG: MFS transporter [Balneolaceae bacterium]
MSQKLTSELQGDIAVSSKPTIFPILLVNFIGSMGFSIVLPFLIILVIKMGGNELIYGILGATYSFFQLIGAPILGRWSDKFGRRKILLLSQGGTLIAWILFFIALILPNTILFEVDHSSIGVFLFTVPLLLLFIARALDGITGGNISVANAYLSDITTEEHRKENFGKMSASANLGFIIGPALAGLLGETVFEEQLPVLATILISVIALFVIQFYLKESNPCIVQDQTQTGQFKKVLGAELKDCYKDESGAELRFLEVIRLPKVGFILILYFLIFLSFNFFYVAFPIHAVQMLEWELFQLGLFFSTMGAIMVFVQGPVLTKISNSVSDKTLVISGSIMLAVSFFLFTNEETVITYSAVVLFASGNGIMWPSFLSILSKVAGKTYQGAIQGYASSTGSLASIIGLISGGLIYGQIWESIFFIPCVLMILIGVLTIKMVTD